MRAAGADGLWMRTLLVSGPRGRWIHDFTAEHDLVLDVRSISKLVAALALSAVDLARIGELFLDGGSHRGRQVVPREMDRGDAVAGRAGEPRRRPRHGSTSYGYGLWICGSGVHYCDGADGQFLIVLPRLGTIVVTLAEEGDTATVARCLEDALRPA
jgi:CubicO group peptidase (beta-lactamase class C family)